jgi:hypothetical protein
MKSGAEAAELRLSGPPQRVSGTLAVDIPKSTVVPISLSVSDEVAIYRARARAIGSGLCEVRVRLPRGTPPGTYRGESRFGDRTRSTTVEIVAKDRIRVQPPQTTLVGAPGGSAAFVVTVVNDGNVALEVPKKAWLDFDDVRGPERALARALRADLEEGEPRAERFFEEIRQDHGGEAQVHVVEGAGRVPPGETRTLKCRLETPPTVEAHRTYAGTWDLGSAGHGIVLEVTNGTTDRARGRKR